LAEASKQVVNASLHGQPEPFAGAVSFITCVYGISDDRKNRAANVSYFTVMWRHAW
jgi:uncharacterized lipoprotein NlpE involved in copper resistance